MAVSNRRILHHFLLLPYLCPSPSVPVVLLSLYLLLHLLSMRLVVASSLVLLPSFLQRRVIGVSFLIGVTRCPAVFAFFPESFFRVELIPVRVFRRRIVVANCPFISIFLRRPSSSSSSSSFEVRTRNLRTCYRPDEASSPRTPRHSFPLLFLSRVVVVFLVVRRCVVIRTTTKEKKRTSSAPPLLEVFLFRCPSS